MATEPKLTIPTLCGNVGGRGGIIHLHRDRTCARGRSSGSAQCGTGARRAGGCPSGGVARYGRGRQRRPRRGRAPASGAQSRPSRLPYALASAASLAWLAGVYYLLSSSAAGDLRTYLGGLSPLEVATAATVTVAPIVLFFIAAMMTVRSFEMRLVGRAVGEVALRLSQPRISPAKPVLNVSRIVRREVAAVGDGLERALARAGELENVVRREISTLEGAYSENEIRIRALLDELVQQREAVVSNADRVRERSSALMKN